MDSASLGSAWYSLDCSQPRRRCLEGKGSLCFYFVLHSSAFILFGVDVVVGVTKELV
jgi:hypothetical protein